MAAGTEPRTPAVTAPDAMAGNYALLVLVACILGSNFMMTGLAMDALTPGMWVALRLGLASLVLLAVMAASGHRFPRGAIWWPILGSAFFGHTLPFSLISWGQQVVDSGLAAIMMATMPLFVLLLAQLFTRDEKPNRYATAGFMMALVGVVILIGPGRLLSLSGSVERELAIVTAALAFGVNAIITKQLTGLAWQTMVASFLVASFVLSLPLAFLQAQDLTQVGADVWQVVAYTAVMPTALGSVLILVVVRRAGASFLSQLNFIVPIVGVVLGVTVMGESLSASAIAALAVILAGLALSQRRSPRDARTGAATAAEGEPNRV